MFTLSELAIASDVDLSRIDPTASEFDQKVEMANQLVKKAMRDVGFRENLTSKKIEFLQDKGWSLNRSHKLVGEVPQDAFVMLPREISRDSKRLRAWMKQYHPYLLYDNVV